MKTFITDCTSARGIDIINMVDSSREITRRTFLKHVDTEELHEIEKQLGYYHKLRMSSDPYVSYFKGKYRGKSCVYFQQSAIEYVFV